MAGMPAYESMLILKAALSKEESDKLVDRFCDVIKAQGGEVGKVDRMGKRKIAYDMKKQPEGFYATINFNAPGNSIAELERQMRLTSDVLKFQTLRFDPATAVNPVKKPSSSPASY